MTTRTYLHLSETEAQTLDIAITSLGYAYRSEFFTACAEHLLYGTPAAAGTPDLPGHTADWLTEQTQILEDASRLRQTTLQVLRDLAHAVIAVKGTSLTLSILENDIKNEVYRRCSMIPDTQEIKHCIIIYQHIHNPELIRHRTELYAEQHLAENQP